MKSILVIEDDLAILENTVEILELERYTVYAATNGKEGIDKAMDILPYLILCDIGMPIMNGWQVLEQIRKEPRTCHIPFVFFTAFSEKPQMQKGLELGANGYIVKPFFSEELLQTVQNMMARPTGVRDC